MDIAFMTPPFPKYSETFITNQIIALIKRGHNVEVFSRGKPSNPAEHAMIEDNHLNELTRHIEPIDDYPSGIKQYLATALNSQSFSDILKSVRYSKQAPTRLKCQEIFQNAKKFDVVHAHFGPISRQWDFVSTLPDQGPFVATYYGYDVTGKLHPNNYDFYTKTDHWNSVDLAIGISEHIRSRMIMVGCPEENSTTLPIGVDPSLFRFSPTPYNSDSELQLVSTCRHTQKKGLEYAIRAVGELKDRGISLSYTIAGDGELTPMYRKLISDAGLEDEVELIGRVPQETVSELMQNAHLYIQPSVTTPSGDMEGQGLVFQEAQATGTPPIATFHDGIPEGVRHAETGRLAPERDVSRLTDEIEYFVTNPNEIINYAKRGREIIEQEYHYIKLAERQEALYESVIKESNSS